MSEREPLPLSVGERQELVKYRELFQQLSHEVIGKFRNGLTNLPKDEPNLSPEKEQEEIEDRIDNIEGALGGAYCLYRFYEKRINPEIVLAKEAGDFQKAFQLQMELASLAENIFSEMEENLESCKNDNISRQIQHLEDQGD